MNVCGGGVKVTGPGGHVPPLGTKAGTASRPGLQAPARLRPAAHICPVPGQLPVAALSLTTEPRFAIRRPGSFHALSQDY
jgi:hypothetical protein